MSGDIGKVSMAVETDTRKFDAGVDASEKKAARLSGTFGKVGVAAKIMGGVVGGATLGALSDFANAAAADEANTIKLQVAVENSGVAYDQYADQINAAIKKGQELAFTDDATRNSLASLTESTGSVEEAMKRLPIAMDLARSKQISLEAASKLLGKVSDENTKALKKLGFVMQEGATATDVLGKVMQVTGGQAEGFANSTAGGVAKVKDQIGEFTEGIGASLGPFQGYLALLPGLSSGMSLAGGAVGGFASLLKFTLTPAQLASIPTTWAMMAPFLPIVGIFVGIGLAVLALKYAWENNLGDIQGKTQAVFAVLGTVFGGIKDTVTSVFGFIVGIIGGAIGIVVGVINGFIDKYNAVAKLLGLPLLGRIEVTLPNLESIENEINQVARDRRATITFANVYEQAIAGGGGVPQYALGTPYVPETGLALLHRGEAVIPAQMNRTGGRLEIGGVENVTKVYLDGREIATAVGRHFVRRAAMVGNSIG